MNSKMSSVRSAVYAAFSIVLLSSFFISCKKDRIDNNPDLPVAGLMGFNLSPDKSAIGFELSGNYLSGTPLAYGSYTGNYLPVYAGQRTINTYELYNQSTALASVQDSLVADRYYSVFFIGSGTNNRNVIAIDSVGPAVYAADKAFIRYVNAITDSVNAPAVTITSGGAVVSSNAAAFATVSEFAAVNPGDITIAVKNAANVDASRTIAVEKGKLYTILLEGVPGSGATPVEIRFVDHGTWENSSNK